MPALFNSTKSGYCRICGQYRKFTADHIPPRSCFNNIPIYVNSPYEKRIEKGLKVQSICAKCNNEILGGGCDNELKSFATQIDNILKVYRDPNVLAFKYTEIFIDKEKFLRGTLGHLLACYGSQEDLKEEIDLDSDCYANRMRKYVCGEKNQFFKEISVLFWMHQYPSIKIVPHVAMVSFNNKNLLLGGSLLSFYPIGIFIVNSNKFPLIKDLKLNELKIDGEKRIKVNVSCIQEEDFPFSLLAVNRGFAFLFNNKSIIHGIKVEDYAK